MRLFDIFKKKEKTVVTIYSPMNGKVIELKDVPDEAFAQKMVGDGCAIEPDKGVICSPVDGQLMNIFPSNLTVSIPKCTIISKPSTVSKISA